MVILVTFGGTLNGSAAGSAKAKAKEMRNKSRAAGPSVSSSSSSSSSSPSPATKELLADMEMSCRHMDEDWSTAERKRAHVLWACGLSR